MDAALPRDFTDQPTEVLWDTLLQLDAVSLLNACSSNSKTNAICQDNYFWLSKLRMDFPEFNLENYDINDARRDYLNKTLFSGEIYVEGILQPVKTILYNDLNAFIMPFVTPDKMVIYSRPTWNFNNPRLTRFAFHVLGVGYNMNLPVHFSRKVLQVDIVPFVLPPNVIPNNLILLGFDDEELRAISRNDPQALVQYTELDVNNNEMIVRMRPRQVISSKRDVYNLFDIYLRDYHISNNTELYQRYTRERKEYMIKNLTHPQVPIITRDTTNIGERKAVLLSKILETNNPLPRDYETRDEFTEAQTLAVNSLTDQQFLRVEYLLNILITVRLNIFFDITGKLVIYASN